MGSVESIDQSTILNHEKKSKKPRKNPTSIPLVEMFTRHFCNGHSQGKINGENNNKIIKLQRLCHK